MKKAFSILLAVAMIFCMFSGFEASGAEDYSKKLEKSGKCGKSVSWSYSEKTGTVTISGSGSTYNYDFDADGGLYISESPLSAIKGIKKVVVKEGVTRIGNYLLCGNVNLASVTLPSSLTSIGWEAFTKAGKLTSLYIPKNVSEISQNPFGYCNSLASIRVSLQNEYFDSRNDCNAIIRKSDDALTTGCKNTIIPNTVQIIEEYAFYRLNSLKYIKIPNGVKIIYASAFNSCEKLEYVELPEGLEMMSGTTFIGAGIKHIDIPEGVEYLGYYSFGFCKNLKSVSIPASVIDINDSFTSSKNVKTVYYASEKSDWKKIEILDDVIGKVENVKYNSIGTSDVNKLGNRTYTGKSIYKTINVEKDGVTLKKGTDYKVSYSNNKNVGTVVVTITGIGNYSGKVIRLFRINPKGTSIKKITSPKSKQLKIEWNKKTTQTTGYEIQLATNSSFTSNLKTVSVSSYKTASKTVTGLKSKTKYFVRIRTYKVKDSMRYYSSWSSYKTYKTK